MKRGALTTEHTNLRTVAAIATMVLLVVAGVMFFAQASERALEVCDFGRDDGPAWMQASGIELGWTWSPVGFECEFVEHDSETGNRWVAGKRSVGLWP